MKRDRGFLLLPRNAAIIVDSRAKDILAAAMRLRTGAKEAGVELVILSRDTGPQKPMSAFLIRSRGAGVPRSAARDAIPDRPEAYALAIDRSGIRVDYREPAGLRAAVATLRQLLRSCGRRLPCLRIRDWPDFPRRGVMLDISRGRVPKLGTLLDLVDRLADFKINEFQLYTEHTFAYRRYRTVWREWGALTALEIRKLDARCRELGIDLVPNQNSFGHLRQWLEYPPLKKLAEVSEPYEDAGGAFLRYPTTLAPENPGTLPFLRGLYDELLPNFSSRFFNVGCDETWDLGRGQSAGRCRRLGKGRVYLEFLKRIQQEVSARGRTMMFWGDIILKYPGLIRELATKGRKAGAIALNWGYEADHPFARETRQFAKTRIPFYVGPGTSTWMTLIGRHDNALANLRRAAVAGSRNGAAGYLITDWGDGGHPQPLAVSWPAYLAGASLSWCVKTFNERCLIPALSRDIFHDPTRRIARAALALGFAHRRFKYREPNVTPFGAAIAAPPPEQRELVCRNGLKYHARIPASRMRAALREVERQRAILRRANPRGRAGQVLAFELDFAARMAVQSCRFMLWQQAVSAGKVSLARALARKGIAELRKLDREFNAFWPLRNKGTTKKCSTFLRWRIEDYLQCLARRRGSGRPGC